MLLISLHWLSRLLELPLNRISLFTVGVLVVAVVFCQISEFGHSMKVLVLAQTELAEEYGQEWNEGERQQKTFLFLSRELLVRSSSLVNLEPLILPFYQGCKRQSFKLILNQCVPQLHLSRMV